MTNTLTENKRKSIRGRVTGFSKVSFRKINSYLISGARIENISETGICIPMNLYYPVNSMIEIGIRLDEFKETITTKARVTRISNQNNGRYRFEAGLEFVELHPEKKNILHHYVQRSTYAL